MRQAKELRHGKPEDVGMDVARVEQIRNRARQWVANGDTPSLVLLVARKGVIVLEEAFGILRPSDNAPLRTYSIFPIASMSKPFTAAAVLCLVEDGLLSLKHPITDYVPEITTPGADQVLIADLLTHTSGYDDLAVYRHAIRGLKAQRPIPAAAPGEHPLIHSLIGYAADAPHTRKPGEAMSYCNFGFELLADVVRRVSGRSFAEFVESRIFGPLAMTDSALVLRPDARSRRVLRQQGYPDVVVHPLSPSSFDSEAYDGFPSGGGGVKTTAVDAAKFGQMMLNGGVYRERRVLSRASIAAMTSPQLRPGTRSYFKVLDANTGKPTEIPIRGGSYGYGLFIVGDDERSAYMNGSLMSPRTYSHDGFGSCSFWVDPDAEIVGVYFSVMPKFRGGVNYFWRFDHFQDMVHAAIVD